MPIIKFIIAIPATIIALLIAVFVPKLILLLLADPDTLRSSALTLYGINIVAGLIGAGIISLTLNKLTSSSTQKVLKITLSIICTIILLAMMYSSYSVYQNAIQGAWKMTIAEWLRFSIILLNVWFTPNFDEK